jgi:hypothetical protein
MRNQTFLSASIVFSLLTVAGCSSPAKQYVAARSPASDQIASAEDVINLMKSWVVDEHPKYGFVTSLSDIEKFGLEKGKASFQPWSGSFWPDRFGGVAGRYRQVNQKVSVIKKPSKNYRKFERLHADLVKNYDHLTREQIQVASPAEKYDLLMGDRNFTFTKAVWDEIGFIDHKTPGIAFWFGICDGWTSSSLVMPRPRATVSAMSPDGKVIDFYPDDLKGLVSYLWAHKVLDGNPNRADGTPKSVMYGYRCKQVKPKRGRDGSVLALPEEMNPTDPDECRDINPGVWHLNVVNRIGAQGRGFVMDVDYNRAVNNHSVAAYDFQYFNLNSGKVGGYQQAMVPVSDYKNDPFRSKRNAATRYIVGVTMNVKYMDYGMPIQGYNYDDESVDKTDVMSVIYDMELDAQQRIVSGQWRVNKAQKKRDIRGFPKPRYPDFMWYQRDLVYAPGEEGDLNALKNHDWSKPLPTSIREMGIKLSSYAEKIWLLADRANYGKTVSKELKAAAEKSSARNDQAWFAYCRAATGGDYCSPLPDSDPKSKLPEIVELKRLADEADVDLESYHAKLDALKVPREKPYPQPMGRVIYSLFEQAKKADINAPRGARMEVVQPPYNEN